MGQFGVAVYSYYFNRRALLTPGKEQISRVHCHGGNASTEEAKDYFRCGMRHPKDDLEDEAVRFLAAYHEALLAGGSGDTDTPVPPEGPGSMEGIRACLRRLEMDRRRSATSPAGNIPSRVGRFQLIRELGQGSFGIVFLAEDPVLNRRVALKVPRPESLFTTDLRQRFLREAKAAACLDHPNIVPVYEAGEADHVCYISGGYCPGPTLAVWLKGQPNLAPPRTAASLVTTLADAMQHAHDRASPPNYLFMRWPWGRHRRQVQRNHGHLPHRHPHQMRRS